MAGSRTETIGTVFTRVAGLLKSGAVKEVDKPLWYDVMAAFPPKIEPSYDRPIDKRPTVDIVYKEDLIRQKYYQLFGNPTVIDLTNVNTPTLSQRFIEMYQNIEKEENIPDEKIIDRVIERLKNEGIQLKTSEQIQQEGKRKRQAKRQKEPRETDTMIFDIFRQVKSHDEEDSKKDDINAVSDAGSSSDSSSDDSSEDSSDDDEAR